MKPPKYEYGELIGHTLANSHTWIFSAENYHKEYDEPLLHKIMTLLGTQGWECVFISNNMLHVFFKKTVIKKPTVFDGGDC